MKNYISILMLLFLMTSCTNKKAKKEMIVAGTFDCKTGEMQSAWYTMGQDEISPKITGLKPEFIILVDTNLKATNFISFHEQYNRENSTELDTSDLNWTDGWDKLTIKQKLEKVRKERKSYQIQADSIHLLNNQGQQLVWIINNSKDTVTIQMQDWSFICILQAKTKSGQWNPMQYWRFSTCGNSYYLKHFPPKTANSFITKLPDKGDYKTKLRFKLLGKDKYYYSNEFDGKINYCEFVEDCTHYNTRQGTPQPHFKLERLINLIWQYD